MTILRGKSVLVVEDEPLVSMMIEVMLEEAGAERIGVAESCAEAATCLAGAHFDVAILDRRLGDGLSYGIAATALAAGTRIIFASGTSDLDLPEGLLGATILPKPFSGAALIAAIAAALEG